MIDHVTLPVQNIAVSSKAFSRALKPLGYAVVIDLTRAQYSGLPYERMVGLGANGAANVWLRPARGPVDGAHLAIHVKDRAVVDAFHAAALAAGLHDDGAPGLRAHYHPTYYAAFVRDSDGHSLEVVCRAAPVVKSKTAQSKPRRAAAKATAKTAKSSAKKARRTR